MSEQKPITTNFKQKKQPKCTFCKEPLNLIGGLTASVFQTLNIKLHPWCLKKKQNEKNKKKFLDGQRRSGLIKREKLKKQKNKERRLRNCLECLNRKRTKGKTKCSDCLRKYDVSYWGTQTWNAFSAWLKALLVTFQGYFICYTCDKTFTIDLAQAGHCFHRGNQHYKALDFDPKHIHLQCGGCNMDSMGNKQNVFQAKLTREIGIEAVEHMIWRRHNEPALTIPELQALKQEFTLKLKEL